MAYYVDVIQFDPTTADRSDDTFLGRFVPEEDGDWFSLVPPGLGGKYLGDAIRACVPKEERDFFWTGDLDDNEAILRSLTEI